jgi:6-phosphogluconolactonase
MRQGSSAGFSRLVAVLGLGAATLLTGCSNAFFTAVNNSGGAGGTGGTSYVYVTNAGGTLTEYSLTSGVLAQLSGSPISLPLAPTAIAIAPNNEFVFIGTSTGVFLYTINSDGTLTEGNADNVVYLNQNLSPAGTPLVVSSMAVDATSSWLIIAYQDSTELDALPIDPTTGLPTSTGAFTATLTFGTLAPQIAMAPANNNIFVALGSGGTEAIGFNPTSTTNGPFGTGVSIHLKTANTSDTAVAVDPTSAYLYITEASLATTPGAGSLRLIKISNLGADLADYPTGIGPSAVLADLSGAYVYVTNSVDDTISGFSFSTTTQTLTSLGDPFPTEKSPVALAEDNSKSYIIDIGNAANPNLWLYSFDASSLGTLDVGSTTSTTSTSPSDSNGIAVSH